MIAQPSVANEAAAVTPKLIVGKTIRPGRQARTAQLAKARKRRSS